MEQAPSRAERWFRFGPLLAAMAIVIFVAPPLEEAGYGRLAVSLAFPALAAACALTVWHAGWLGWVAVALLGVSWGIEVSTQLRLEVIAFWGRIVDAMFIALVGWVLIRGVVRSRRVTADTILGGVSVYMLIGLFFVAIYSSLEIANPGSFLDRGELLRDAGGATGRLGRYPALTYYSLVTMTTLGYGDITPTTALARSLAAAQAVLGQLYVAILIAFLVGILISHRQAGD